MNYYFDSSSEKAALLLSIRLKSIINTKKKPNQEIIILCIGSDRSTGDSLGPLIGYKLKKAPDRKSTRLNSSHNNQSRMPSSA